MLSALLEKRSTWVWATALGGGVVALSQWLLLRRVATHAIWWMVASPLGWILASSFVLINDRWIPRIPGIVGALLYVGVVLVGGVVLGMCTAPAAMRLSRVHES